MFLQTLWGVAWLPSHDIEGGRGVRRKLPKPMAMKEGEVWEDYRNRVYGEAKRLHPRSDVAFADIYFALLGGHTPQGGRK